MKIDMRRLCLCVARVMLVSLLFLPLAPHPAASQGYVSSESHSILEGDGHTIRSISGSWWGYMHPGTKIEVNETSELVVIKLFSGRALFHVRHDDRRLLLVKIGKATIKDVGTQFEVFREWGRAGVDVIEGEVLLSGTLTNREWRTVSVGDKARILSDGFIFSELEISRYGPEASKPRPHEFDHHTLGYAANEFNSESRRYRFIVEGEARELPFSGKFLDDEEFVRALLVTKKLRVVREGHIFLVTMR